MSLTNHKLKSLELLHEWWEKCKIAACSATVPTTEDHVCNYAHTYVSRFPGEEFKPESLNLTVKHLLKIMIWCCMARSEVGHCRWNCQCDQMHWYTAEVRGAISLALFQKAYPFCLKDDNEPCHLAKLVSTWKCQNTSRTLTSPAQSQDSNPIENLWRKITSEIVKRHPTIKRKLIEPPGTGESPTTTSSRCPLNSDTMLKSDYEQRLAQNILTRQVNVKLAF